MKRNTMVVAMALLASCTQTTEKKTETAHTKEAYNATGKKVLVYTTADTANYRITLTDTLSFSPKAQPLESEISVFVDPGKSFQTFFGIGAALTDASAETFYKMPKDKQQEMLKAYFDKKDGIGYTVARTNINSCDFSSDMYTYVQDGDKDLKTFNIAHDMKFKIPFIKEAAAAAGGKLALYASPWSPPAWMKDTKDMLHGGKLLPEFYDSWAMYYTKFIKEYEKAGVPVWGLSIQNEPMAKQIWESCIYTAEEERDFLKTYLGPTLKKAGLGDKKIIVWDHNRDLMSQRASVIFEDKEASKYAWGMGFHWYENWSGGEPMYGNVGKVHEMYPDKNLMFTEGCVEKFDAANYQLWANGERYGKSLIHDFNNGTVGWTDWNILLDEHGGPNHVGNFCFAPVHANTQTGALIFTPSYYMLGHFSKFITKGAHRISSVASRSQLLTTAFRNPDGKVVTVVMNPTDKEVSYFLCEGLNAAPVVIKAHAIQTLIF